MFLGLIMIIIHIAILVVIEIFYEFIIDICFWRYRQMAPNAHGGCRIVSNMFTY